MKIFYQFLKLEWKRVISLQSISLTALIAVSISKIYTLLPSVFPILCSIITLIYGYRSFKEKGYMKLLVNRTGYTCVFCNVLISRFIMIMVFGLMLFMFNALQITLQNPFRIPPIAMALPKFLISWSTVLLFFFLAGIAAGVIEQKRIRIPRSILFGSIILFICVVPFISNKASLLTIITDYSITNLNRTFSLPYTNSLYNFSPQLYTSSPIYPFLYLIFTVATTVFAYERFQQMIHTPALIHNPYNQEQNLDSLWKWSTQASGIKIIKTSYRNFSNQFFNLISHLSIPSTNWFFPQFHTPFDSRNQLLKESHLNGFIYLCHPDEIPSFITVNDLCSTLINLGKIPRKIKHTLYQHLNIRDEKNRKFSELSISRQFEILLILNRKKCHHFYVFDLISGNYTSESIAMVINIGQELINKNSHVVLLMSSFYPSASEDNIETVFLDNKESEYWIKMLEVNDRIY